MNSSGADDLTSRIAQRALTKRGANYAAEVRGLLDAALEMIRTRGTTSRPRVSDIVAAAGLSNETFYRHFSSKDALVAALLEDGMERRRAYVEHQMSKATTPEDKVRRWVEGVLNQASGDTAETTRAVSWNAGSVGEEIMPGRRAANRPMASLLREPFAEFGSDRTEFDASLAAHAVMGALTEYLWRRAAPSAAELDQITEFCLRALTPRTWAAGFVGTARPPSRTGRRDFCKRPGLGLELHSGPKECYSHSQLRRRSGTGSRDRPGGAPRLSVARVVRAQIGARTPRPSGCDASEQLVTTKPRWPNRLFATPFQDSSIETCCS